MPFSSLNSSPPIPAPPLIVDTLFELRCDGEFDGTINNLVASVLVDLFPQCSDGVDNDGDGEIDSGGGPLGEPADTDCGGDPSRDDEGFNLDLQINPFGLISSGDTVTLIWTTINVEPNSCSVSGSNGESFVGDSNIGQETSPIEVPTLFTLQCNDLSGNPVSDSELVRVRPRFEEF